MSQTRSFDKQSLRRLATAAALESVGYQPVPAWQLAGKLPEQDQLQICVAGRNPIRNVARRDVARILRPLVCHSPQ